MTEFLSSIFGRIELGAGIVADDVKEFFAPEGTQEEATQETPTYPREVSNDTIGSTQTVVYEISEGNYEAVCYWVGRGEIDRFPCNESGNRIESTE